MRLIYYGGVDTGVPKYELQQFYPPQIRVTICNFTPQIWVQQFGFAVIRHMGYDNVLGVPKYGLRQYFTAKYGIRQGCLHPLT